MKLNIQNHSINNLNSLEILKKRDNASLVKASFGKQNFPESTLERKEDFIKKDFPKLNAAIFSHKPLSTFPSTFLPPYRTSLPVYGKKFTEYNSNKSSSGLKDIIQNCGYNSIEYFLASTPADIFKVLKSSYKSPKQEAIELVVTGGNRTIRHYIDGMFEIVQKNINDEIVLEKKQDMANSFRLEMETQLRNWEDYIKEDGNRIITLMKKELESISFRSNTRWFLNGPWPNTSDKSKWIKNWQKTYLPLAKKAVQSGVQQTIYELSSSLRNKIKTLSDELDGLAVA